MQTLGVRGKVFHVNGTRFDAERVTVAGYYLLFASYLIVQRAEYLGSATQIKTRFSRISSIY